VKVSGLLTLGLCVFGTAQSFMGLEVSETCELFEGQDFDADYWAAHQRDWPLPPYSAPCNAAYDMVPGWVNPAIAVTAAACAVSTAGFVAAGGGRRVPAERPRLR
jgi:hypothetical protein